MRPGPHVQSLSTKQCARVDIFPASTSRAIVQLEPEHSTQQNDSAAR